VQNSAEVSRAGWLGGDMLLPTAAYTQGDELAPECAPYYFAYGDALLTSEDHTARDLADVGASGPGPFEEGEGTDAAMVRPHSPGGRERPDDDIELAWEMLEGARVCYDRLRGGQRGAAVHGAGEGDGEGQWISQLADVHSRLGDLHGANEMFDEARREYESALALRQRVVAVAVAAAAAREGGEEVAGKGSSREARDGPYKVAAELCNIGRALQWTTPPLTARAVEMYRRAVAVLAPVQAAAAVAEEEAAAAEVAAHLRDLEAKIDELQQAATSATAAGSATAVTSGTKRAREETHPSSSPSSGAAAAAAAAPGRGRRRAQGGGPPPPADRCADDEEELQRQLLLESPGAPTTAARPLSFRVVGMTMRVAAAAAAPQGCSGCGCAPRSWPARARATAARCSPR
jgi:tetratricopeptide (TPR) repeat protein